MLTLYLFLHHLSICGLFPNYRLLRGEIRHSPSLLWVHLGGGHHVYIGGRPSLLLNKCQFLNPEERLELSVSREISTREVSRELALDNSTEWTVVLLDWMMAGWRQGTEGCLSILWWHTLPGWTICGQFMLVLHQASGYWLRCDLGVHIEFFGVFLPFHKKTKKVNINFARLPWGPPAQAWACFPHG